MKKSLIFIAILAVATALFAENESVSCESDSGKCKFERSGEMLLNIECVCRDGEEISEVEETDFFPDDEECLAQLDWNYCHNSDYLCENEAGNCSLQSDGEYFCHCLGILSVKGTLAGTSHNYSAEGCTAILEKECGIELATPRSVCADDELLNECASYTKAFTNMCQTPMTDENFEANLDNPLSGDVGGTIAKCCLYNSWRKKYKESFECLEAFGSCENKEECCLSCGIPISMEGAGNDDDEVISPAPDDEADTGKTEIPGDTGDSEPTDGATDSGDTENSEAPADGATAPAENKAEKKSDGCSMLFV